MLKEQVQLGYPCQEESAILEKTGKDSCWWCC